PPSPPSSSVLVPLHDTHQPALIGPYSSSSSSWGGVPPDIDLGVPPRPVPRRSCVLAKARSPAGARRARALCRLDRTGFRAASEFCGTTAGSTRRAPDAPSVGRHL